MDEQIDRHTDLKENIKRHISMTETWNFKSQSGQTLGNLAQLSSFL